VRFSSCHLLEDGWFLSDGHGGSGLELTFSERSNELLLAAGPAFCGLLLDYSRLAFMGKSEVLLQFFRDLSAHEDTEL
jgi:hypothetical protein